MKRAEFVFSAPPEMEVVFGEHAFPVNLGSVESFDLIDQLGNLEEKIKSGERVLAGPQDVRDICADIGRSVNGFLGEGAYEKIFAGRTVNLFDHFQLAAWLVTQIGGLMVDATAEVRNRAMGGHVPAEIEPPTAEERH